MIDVRFQERIWITRAISLLWLEVVGLCTRPSTETERVEGEVEVGIETAERLGSREVGVEIRPRETDEELSGM